MACLKALRRKYGGYGQTVYPIGIYLTTILILHISSTGQEKFACNDLPSSSIDEAAITRYCKDLEMKPNQLLC